MDDLGLVFGWRTALLGAAAAQCVILAVALIWNGGNRTANRMLAATLVVIAGLLTPYALGFAGFYDAFRWLTFAPVAVPLAVGPLLYGYSYALADGRAPARFRRHLILPGLQFTYLAACFLMPTEVKWDWYTGGHGVWVGPSLDAIAPLILAAYAWAIGRVLSRHRARLADQRSDDDRFSARWLTRVRAAILIGVAAQGGFWLWSALSGGIDFFQETGLYLGLGALGLYLGVAGWRHAALPVPLARSEAASAGPGGSAPTAPDWIAIATDIEARTRTDEWWREPDLTLPRLARLMGTNTGRVSRAINLGLGVNFSTFVNGLRAEAVADALRAGARADLLDLALDMGFASKASFNRAFRARFGVAPSGYRRHVSNLDSQITVSKLRRSVDRGASR